MEYEMITARAGDLLPGAWWQADPTTCAEINWAPYEESFRVLIANPDATGDELPLCQPWQAWCKRRFGYVPTGTELPSKGGLWAWSYMEEAMKRLLKGFQEHGGFDPDRKLTAEWPIRIVIEGNGRLLVSAGNKRVALIRVLHGLDHELQVGIHHRDDAWRAHRRILMSICGGNPQLYQPLPHPDFASWTVSQPCVERWAMMAEFLGEAWKGSVLDLGCHTGWFCRAFAEAGSTALGVDENYNALVIAEIMSRFRHDGRPSPRYLCADLNDFLLSNRESFDVCLYLSTIMHTFQRDGAECTWAGLRQVSALCPILFLDCVWGGYSEHLPFTPDTLGEAIMTHTDYKHCRLLGLTQHEARPFYVFTREEPS